ncbi:hypothetical protein [Pedobacter sp. MW01-1-1]|uniref:hypothetical protein n=1 Tax=Pedobacter sp. MW01-1-1 TaxID=3383027 RepID=UPI003FEF0660
MTLIRIGNASIAFTKMFLFLLISFLIYEGIVFQSWMKICSGVLLLLVSIYLYYLKGRFRVLEPSLRSHLYKVLGIYFLPEWLTKRYVNECFASLEKRYFRAYQSDWKADLMQEHISIPSPVFLYELAVFNYLKVESPENEFYYYRAKFLHH